MRECDAEKNNDCVKQLARTIKMKVNSKIDDNKIFIVNLFVFTAIFH